VAGTAPLARVLDYLVFRSQECRAPQASTRELTEMLQLNVQEALGRELPAGLQLELECPVYADARLAPHEWIEARDGSLLKMDAIDHGDDHFLPGPCDSAWDVAGAILEWQLAPGRAREFCECYRRRTRDDVAARLSPYLLAYAALRVARADLAALSASPEDKLRLARDRQRCYSVLSRLVDAEGEPPRSWAALEREH
jgi:hypothetical protein